MKKLITSFTLNGSVLRYYLEISEDHQSFIFTPCRSNKDNSEFKIILNNNELIPEGIIPSGILEQALEEIHSLLTNKIPEKIHQLICESFLY
ncbi:MAG TPA: hypothetical protein VFQ58_07345 [Flavisolibacter sp.]|jgi:hypothetical protein|nr:hypothetical protein [Flavisolibacter sp.]